MSEISIIMPIYNAESTLKKTLESVIIQDFNKQYELILINDGSVDNSEEICLEFASKYDFIKYKKVENGGVSRARNLGLELAESKYIMFLDSDDFLEKNALSTMFSEINAHNSDLVIAGYNRVNESNNRIVLKSMCCSNYNRSNFNILIEKAQTNNLFNQLWNKLFKLEVIRQNKIQFDVSLSLGEDYKFVMTYMEYCENIRVINNVIYNYINNTSGLNTKYHKNRLELNLNNLELLEKFYKKNGYNESYLYKKYVKTCLSGVNNICKNPDKKEKNKQLKKFVSNKEIHKRLNEYKVISDIKYKILIVMLNAKSIFLLKLIALLLYIYESFYKKIKLGY